MTEQWSEWLNWNGGKQPVADDVMVEIKTRCSDVTGEGQAGHMRWSFDGDDSDIIRYRIKQPASLNVKWVDEMPSDLRWLAENVSEWVGQFEYLGVISHEPHWRYTKSATCKYNKDDWQAARQQLGLTDNTETEEEAEEWERLAKKQPAWAESVPEGVIGSKRTAENFLMQAADLMAERGKQYDAPQGERTMGKTVAAFNTITGRDLTEGEGWLLMSLLKRVRQHSGAGYHRDSAEDAVAYAALEAEALELGGNSNG